MASRADTTPTSITVPTFVRKALAKYKQPGETYGDVILQFIEEWPSPEFLAEMARREREEPSITLRQLRKLPGY